MTTPIECAEPDPRQYRYRVTDVWGTMTKQLEVGSVIIDSDHGDEHDWTVYNLDSMTPIGGWSGTFIGMLGDGDD